MYSTKRRFPSVEPFGVDDAFLLVITQRVVKRLHLLVVRPYHQLQFFDAALAQPILRRGHDRAAVAFVATVGIDRHVIHPAAMAIVANQHRRHDLAGVAPGQHIGIRHLASKRDIGGGIVPGPRQSAALPQRDDGGDIRILDWRNRQ